MGGKPGAGRRAGHKKKADKVKYAEVERITEHCTEGRWQGTEILIKKTWEEAEQKQPVVCKTNA